MFDLDRFDVEQSDPKFDCRCGKFSKCDSPGSCMTTETCRCGTFLSVGEADCMGVCQRCYNGEVAAD